MRHPFFSLFSILALSSTALADVAYEFAPNFITPPAGKETIGNGHGEIACDSAGNFYVSVQGPENKDAGVQVYGPDGKFIKALPLPNSLHGFVIREDEGHEYLFGAVLGEARVIKAKLDSSIVMEIPTSAFPADKAGPKGLKLTNCDVAPNGDIYVVDGYGIDWIFVFDRAGKFKKVFGGRGEPLKLSNTHKIFIDRRYEPARILACDRGNNRILHLDLEGNLISVYAEEGLRRPSSASFHGDLVCIAEIAGRVSVWDKEGKQVASLGVNDTAGQTNTPKVEPKDWQQGTVTSPHGITFDNAGNILETEWNLFGRVLRWNKK
ncbi:hypothetical protein SAMN02745166_00656 [Prosthecobacter debontii]|uniref:NHL repeat-containing protein n=1 Tax=Prosthecobacter debontii TaxID=48467 RepID=A0A1T4WUP1_9BACT|nr:6-bladed beta-propeller [Prosthecobacter debontii]SKA80575.1 hypothetical protein SAMN02745166_00656 [Prosthecobacter debontii]